MGANIIYLHGRRKTASCASSGGRFGRKNVFEGAVIAKSLLRRKDKHSKTMVLQKRAVHAGAVSAMRTRFRHQGKWKAGMAFFPDVPGATAAGRHALVHEHMENAVDAPITSCRLLQIDHGKPLASMDAKASRIVFRGVRVPGKVPSGTWSDRRSGWYAKKFQARRTGCKKAGLTKS